jgi:hypothetical protein
VEILSVILIIAGDGTSVKKDRVFCLTNRRNDSIMDALTDVLSNLFTERRAYETIFRAFDCAFIPPILLLNK